RRHTRFSRDWSSDVCSSDLVIEPYGRFKAKVPIGFIDEEKIAQSNLILVTAITPTKAGIGKTTVSIGLALGLQKLGKNAVLALRSEERRVGKECSARWWPAH